MIVVRKVLGTVEDSRFATRRVERVTVRWNEAPRPRLRRATDVGTDLAIDLPRGSYLADGLVLDDNGQRLVVVERPPEPALCVHVDPALALETFVQNVALVAHAFGNQHVPLEVEDGEIRVPITTSEHLARETITHLDLPGVTISVDEIPLGRQRPLSLGDRHA